MTAPVKVLAISGSLRRLSYNRQVVGVAAEGARLAGAEVAVADLRDFPMPVYNPDDHDAGGFDPNAMRLQSLMAEHDGFLIASPEYNGSLSAALKNAIDWCSRPGGAVDRGTVFRHKAAALLTAGPGAFGGLRTLAHMRGVLTSVGAHVIPNEIAVPYVDRIFAEDGSIVDAKTEATLHGVGRALVRMLELLRGAAGA